MNTQKRITLPLDEQTARGLRAGDQVLLTGSILTGRDAAHKKLCALLDGGQPLPVELCDEVIYYVGPTPAPPGHAVGSAGPTTSSRMDSYAPRLIALGLRGMIGKGKRSAEVVEAMKTHGCVYFGAIGGAGALLSRSICSATVLCYPELGTEAIHRFEVVDFPVTVIIDTLGKDLYQSQPPLYAQGGRP